MSFTRTLLAIAAASLATGAIASSHREAPFITTQPKVDGTDFYMFRSYEPNRAGFVTLIANYQPLQDSYGGPNYFTMDPDALYEIHIDNNGNAAEDITFQFRFSTAYGRANIPSLGITNGNLTVTNDADNTTRQVQAPLANIGGGMGSTTGALNVVETFTATVVRGDRRTGRAAPITAASAGGAGSVAAGASVFTKPVDNIGQKSIPDYAGYANQFIYNVTIPDCTGQAKMFVGQRREGFVVNLGQVFDQINLNPLGARDSGRNIIDDKNITSLALEVPTSCLTNGTEPVIGAWTTASVRQSRVFNPSPATLGSSAGKSANVVGGPFVQVSRLGSPLVNEVVIGITDKDKFNSSSPAGDVGNFANYVLFPTLPELVQVLFSVPAPATPRADILAAFVTGIRTSVNGTMTDFTRPAGVNLTTLAGSGEMLRLNTAFPANPTPAASQNNLGFLGCDLAGFPNGRRPVDDVVDIALTVVEGAITAANANNVQTCDVSGPTPVVRNAGTVVNDGANTSISDYLTTFPYLNTPIPGAVTAAN